jgi:hypothetical protein
LIGRFRVILEVIDQQRQKPTHDWENEQENANEYKHNFLIHDASHHGNLFVTFLLQMYVILATMPLTQAS